jgi:hypothetical protein
VDWPEISRVRFTYDAKAYSELLTFKLKYFLKQNKLSYLCIKTKIVLLYLAVSRYDPLRDGFIFMCIILPMQAYTYCD